MKGSMDLRMHVLGVGDGVLFDAMMTMFGEAFDWLVRAANARPDDPVILEHLGLVLREQGQPEEALDVFRRALAAGGDREKLEAFIAELEDGR